MLMIVLMGGRDLCAQQPRAAMLGLQGYQGENIAKVLHATLKKNKSLHMLDLDVLAPKKRRMQQLETQQPKLIAKAEIHQHLSAAKIQYQKTYYAQASEALKRVIASYHKHLYEPEVAQGLSTAYFYQGLTHYQQNQKDKAIEDLNRYFTLVNGLVLADNSDVSYARLSSKSYSPEIQDFYAQAYRVFEQKKASTKWAYFRLITEYSDAQVWINGQSLSAKQMNQMKCVAGEYLVLIKDGENAPLYSQRMHLKLGENTVHLEARQGSKAIKNTYFNWQSEKQHLVLTPEHKKKLAQLSIQHHIDVFILLHAGEKNMYAHLYDARKNSLSQVALVQDALSFSSYVSHALDAQGYVRADLKQMDEQPSSHKRSQ